MRAYTLINSYVCGIQVGIQASHSIVELMRVDGSDSDVREWADHHKTMSWLNGGDSMDMARAVTTLEDLGITFSIFAEPGMGDMVTAITFVLGREYRNIIWGIRNNKTDVHYIEDYVIVKVGNLRLEMSQKRFDFLKMISELRTKSL